MVWYPSIEDVVHANIAGLSFGGDRHPHELLRSRTAIQVVIERTRELESRGITFQAAFLMKELVRLHAFAGGNHRAAFLVALFFLRQNGRRLRVEDFKQAHSFISEIECRNIEEIQEWIMNG